MIRRILILVFVATLVGAGCGSDVTDDARADSGITGDAADTIDAGGPDGADSADAADGADAAPSLPERPWSVEEPGPYNVGFEIREITYDADGTDEPRTLRLALWYPTVDESGEVSKYFDFYNRPEAFSEASPALDEPAPLLVFSHGNSSLAEQSFFMTEFFASHGWVVAAPDHTGNTFTDTAGAIDLTSAVFRSQDISAVLDEVLSLPDDDALAGGISEEDIVLSGHSFGGVTTLASTGAEFAVDELVAECEQDSSSMCEIFDGRDDWRQLFEAGFLDERIKVAIPQAPGGYEAFRDGLAAIETPTLLFTGAMDRTLPPEEEGDPIWEAMVGPQHLRIDLERGGHFTFSNMCMLFGTIDSVKEDGCSDEFIEPEIAYALINAYSLAFARYHLFDDRTDIDLLSGDRRPFDGLEMSRKPE
ncbi:MAG: alpha/beta hydrolase family protein [Persicimonas sp.]